MTTLETGKRIALRNVMFATDFSACSDVALPYALAIARQYEAKLFAAHVMACEDYMFATPDLWPAYVQRDAALEKEAGERLDKQFPEIAHKSLVARGDVWPSLSRLAASHGIDLLVVGTHGRTGARKLLMGSVAEKIFRQAACPVLTVGPKAPPKKAEEITFQHILFATNFGPESLHAVSYAVSLAAENEGEVTLLHVVEQPAAGVPDLENMKLRLARRLADLVPGESAPWCKVEYVVRFSSQYASPAERILEVARERAADLIVLGVKPAEGGAGTTARLAHTTAQQVVAHALCPVLTVRAED
ncbi:MAG TPA: universal stress protein [Candidatus Binatia bacterium]|nr:universal stress protein [Candidatus Binatia bacterium]